MSRMRRSVGTVAAGTMASRVLGLARDMLMSRVIGQNLVSSAFLVAFTVPNLARRLFGEGALTSAFVPVFKELAETDRMDAARRLARAVATMAWLMLGAAVLLATLGIWGALALWPGMPERMRLAMRLLPIMLPYAVFICAAAFGMAVLNALGRFAAAALVPCVLNVVWIGALLSLLFLPGLAPFDRVKLLAWAVLAAGALQMACMLWAVRRRGVPLRLSREGWRDDATRLVWRNTATAIVGAGAIQINALLDQVLAMSAAEWAPTAISNADRLMELPLSLFGTAFGTVLLPTFAGHFSKGDAEGARAALRAGVRDMSLLMVPAAAGLALLAGDVAGVIYQGGRFTAADTVRVARALSVYAVGLAFFGLSKALTPWFHAQNDMRTPLRVAVRMVLANFTLNLLSVLFLPVEWRHVGIAASTVICSAASCAWLVALARRRNGPLGLAALRGDAARILLAAGAMAAVLAPTPRLLGTLLPGESFGLRAARLGLAVALGAAAYFAALAALLPGALRRLRRGRNRRGA